MPLPRSRKIPSDDCDRAADAVSALRDRDGDARSSAWRTMESRPVLGVPPLRTALLDHPSRAATGQERSGFGLKERFPPARAASGWPGSRGGLSPAQLLDFPLGSPYTDPVFKLSVRLAETGQSAGFEGRSSAPPKFPGRLRRPSTPRSVCRGPRDYLAGAVHRRTRVCRPGLSLAF
jgi:hypothetical protein